MPDLDTVLGWRGKTVLDREGEKVGTLGDLYLDGETERPAYAGVRTGLFKRRESVVPLDGAQETDDGLRLPYSAQQIREAPNLDPDVELSDEEADRLRAHYEPGAEVTRSEEEVEFRTEPMRPKERVRIKKHVVVDHVEKTVPVRREEVRVEHDPPPAGRIVREE